MQHSDIKQEDGIPDFDIVENDNRGVVENDNRGVKTLAGARRIPVNERLIALGFV